MYIWYIYSKNTAKFINFVIFAAEEIIRKYDVNFLYLEISSVPYQHPSRNAPGAKNDAGALSGQSRRGEHCQDDSPKEGTDQTDCPGQRTQEPTPLWEERKGR